LYDLFPDNPLEAADPNFLRSGFKSTFDRVRNTHEPCRSWHQLHVPVTEMRVEGRGLSPLLELVPGCFELPGLIGEPVSIADSNGSEFSRPICWKSAAGSYRENTSAVIATVSIIKDLLG
jgi:hypothetical protein